MPTAHRLSEIQRTSDRFRYRLTLPAGNPYFDGHFPDNPILPGVGQLHLLTAALAGSLQRDVTWREVHHVRFRKPILPDAPCELTATKPDSAGLVDFRIEADGVLLADGRIVVHCAVHAGDAPPDPEHRREDAAHG
jgi:3-hydroxymyristoyl/3-hydroxydecanoyl-(acyl carrier protein) dehydratase